MSTRDLLRQAHMTGEAKEDKSPKKRMAVETDNVQTEEVVVEPEVVKEKVMEKVAEPKREKVIKKQAVKKPALEEVTEDLPTGAAQVKRPDVSANEYGVKPDITNFQLYNYQLSEFLTSFSKQNKKNGGNPITKSQLMETILGFAMYDLELEPEGFETTQDLLASLQSKLKDNE